MNFQGVAPLWLSGVRWNSSAALLVAFPSLFQLSSKNRNSPDPELITLPTTQTGALFCITEVEEEKISVDMILCLCFLLKQVQTS